MPLAEKYDHVNIGSLIKGSKCKMNHHPLKILSILICKDFIDKLPELLLRRSPSKKVQPSELQLEDRQLGAPEKSSLALEETVNINNRIH